MPLCGRGASRHAPGTTADGKVNLNTADAATLETLPRVGPAMAARIIAWREANGRLRVGRRPPRRHRHRRADLRRSGAAGDRVKLARLLPAAPAAFATCGCCCPRSRGWAAAWAVALVRRAGRPRSCSWAATAMCAGARNRGGGRRCDRARLGGRGARGHCDRRATRRRGAETGRMSVRRSTETVHGSPFEAVDRRCRRSRVLGCAETATFRSRSAHRCRSSGMPSRSASASGHSSSPTRWRSWVRRTRCSPQADAARAALLSATNALPGAGGELLPGLAVGDTSRVSASLDRGDEDRVADAPHRGLRSELRDRGRADHAGAATAAARMACCGVAHRAGGFVVLVTPQPSVLRAAVMAMVVLVALARGRPASGRPGAVPCDRSCCWSSTLGWRASTASRSRCSPPLGSSCSRPASRHGLERWLPSWLALAVAVPVAAQAACQPVLVLLEPSLPTYGVLANLLAAPAAPIATVLGLVVCALAIIAPPLAARHGTDRVAARGLDRCRRRVLREPADGEPAVAGGACGSRCLLIGLALLAVARTADRRRIALLVAIAARGIGVRAGRAHRSPGRLAVRGVRCRAGRRDRSPEAMDS